MKKQLAIVLVLALVFSLCACSITIGKPTESSAPSKSTTPSTTAAPLPDPTTTPTTEPATEPSAAPVELDAVTVFEDALIDAGLYYTDEGLSSDGKYQQFSLTYESDYVDEITINCFVDQVGLHIFAWYLVEVPESRLQDAYVTVNEINDDYRWSTFVLDTSDNTVTAKYDLWFAGDECFGLAGVDAIETLVSVIEEVYPTLQSLATEG